MKQHEVYVFDLDGVITNPEDSSVDHGTIKYIHMLIQQGALIAINTGRSYAWVKDNLIDILTDMGGSVHFDHLYVVCEKGGESLAWRGGAFCPQPSRFALSGKNIQLCKQVFDDNAAELTTMFWDSTKQTMATIEKRPDVSLAAFHIQQKILISKLIEVFPGDDTKVDGTTVATDVEFPGAGKQAGAELIYEWVIAHVPDNTQMSFVCVGDSKSDYEMARYFAGQGDETTFVFVGKKNETFSEHDGVQLIRMNEPYTAGAKEYFSYLDA